MKRFLIIVAIILALVAGGLAIFIATFDADRYRPLLVDRLQQALGRPVQLRHIRLGWRQGLAIELEGLSVADDAATSSEPRLQAESISAVIRLLPLLKKDVQVSSIVIRRPTIDVVRDAQGHVNLLGLTAAVGPAAAPSHTTIGNTPVSLQIAALRIENGTVHWLDRMARSSWSSDEVRAIDLTISHIVPGQPMDVQAQAILGSAESANLQARGQITLPSASSQGGVRQFKASVKNLPLDRILPPAEPGAPRPDGLLTANLEGQISTLAPSQLVRAIAAAGVVTLANARIARLNILRMVFEKLSVIPGLVERLEAKLPDAYRDKLAAPDTIFSPMQISWRLDAGVLRFERFDLRTDAFRLTGEGAAGLDGAVNVQSMLSIEPQLSTAIVKSVHELQALGNAAGELELPVLIQGTAPQLSIMPDMKYVTSKVVVTTAADLLDRFLKKQAGDAPPQGEPQPDQQPADLLGNLLERALRKHAPKDVPASP